MCACQRHQMRCAHLPVWSVPHTPHTASVLPLERGNSTRLNICEKLQLEEKELECSHRFPEAISIAIAQCTSAVCIYSQLRTGGRLHKESSGVFAFSRAHAFMCVCGVQRPHHNRMHIAIANGVALDYFRSALIRVHIILEFCAHSYSVLLKF